MMKTNRNTFYCFSPPVMIATFILEAVLFIYTMVRYKLSNTTRVVGGLLLLLAIFQLAEYNVCTNSGVDVSVSTRIGFIAITYLPVLALHFILLITGKSWRAFLYSIYAIGTAWSLLFLRSSAFQSYECGGNYAIFQLRGAYGSGYFAYYYLAIFVGIGLCLYLANSANKRVRTALLWQLAGYLSFILPTAVTNTLNPKTILGLPSVMCGFAVFYALTLVFAITPSLGVAPRKLDARAK